MHLLSRALLEVSYGESLRTMDEHVDGGSNPNEMAEAVYKIIQTKEPRVHYKVGFYAAIFDCIETILRIKSTKMLMNHYKL
jgi:hypothetical protein